jgi:hypothetical protein
VKGFIRISVTVIIVHAAAFSPAAFAASTGDFLAEAAVGALCGYGAAGAGFALFYYGNEWMSGNDDDLALMLAGTTLIAAYPAATATGVYFTGEAVDGPSANKGTAWGLPTFAAYGATVVLVGGTAAAGAGHIGVIADAVTKPFLTAWVYNWVKKPAAAGESRGPTLEPYVAVTTAGNGAPVPVYGVTLSF